MWPPVPTIRPRWTHSVRTYVPAWQLTQKIPDSARVRRAKEGGSKHGHGRGLGKQRFLPLRCFTSYVRGDVFYVSSVALRLARSMQKKRITSKNARAHEHTGRGRGLPHAQDQRTAS